MSVEKPKLNSSLLRRLSAYFKLFAVLGVKVIFLFAFLPSGPLQVFGKSIVTLLLPTSWIYEETVKEYVMQNVFYLEVADEENGESFFADLQRQGVIDQYSQPFTGLDIPYYRVQFSVRDDVAKRTIALLLSNGSLSSVEGVPLFEIQQFSYGNTLPSQSGNDIPKRKLLTGKPVRFTTQQVREDAFERQWYVDEIGLMKENLACITTDKPKIKVAIIDNAFMAQHPSFEKSIRYVRDIADGDDDVSPPYVDEEWMHGSHGAGLIAGKKFDDQGIIGTSLGSAELYLFKATSDSAQPNEITHGIEAFAKAVEMNVDIISLSWGAYMDFPVFRKIVQKALDNGIVVIAAAGNYGSDDLFYPAAYNQVIGVGSFDKSFQVSTFSNFGSWVSLYAPGEELVVPDSEMGFAKTHGTSAAAPLFAGVYSLLLRSFGKDVALKSLYTRTVGKLSYLDISTVCNEKNREEREEVFPSSIGLIQQVTLPDTGTVLPKPEEHLSAPEQMPTPIPVLSFWQRIFLLTKQWMGWIGGSLLFALWFSIRLFKKTIPKSMPPGE